MRSNDTLSKDDLSGRSWHAKSPDETVDALTTDRESGLSEEEAGRRLERFGENRLTPQSERTLLRRFFSQFNNLFIYLLRGAIASYRSLHPPGTGRGQQEKANKPPHPAAKFGLTTSRVNLFDQTARPWSKPRKSGWFPTDSSTKQQLAAGGFHPVCVRAPIYGDPQP